MSQILRRVMVISAGVAALTAEFAIPHGAKADELIESAADEQRCLAVGGQISRNGSDEYCSTPELDARCNQINPAQYDQNGNRITWYFDYGSGTCAKSPCFLTSACADFAGLPDDCFELSVLRRFRDEVLTHMPRGKDDIALYYRVAPAIVERIGASPQRSRELARLYVLYVLPSAFAAWLGWVGVARRIYTRMMRNLAARYRIALV
ncbi:MAG TPA: CFI-box-CTERM domain-containing protein [Stellaceae bacterium]|nr:CFI-box-CTERM domain-containing protein [Stellaceae bacterium]